MQNISISMIQPPPSFQQEIFNLIAALTGHNANYVTPKEYMRFLKDGNAALIFSQLVYWTGKQSDPDGWIYKSYAEWEEEVFLPEKVIRNAVKKMKRFDLVETQVRKIRLPNGTLINKTCVHYRVKQQNLTDLLLNQLKSLGKDDSAVPGKDDSAVPGKDDSAVPSFIHKTTSFNYDHENAEAAPTANLKPDPVVEPTATSSSFFSQDDLNNLMQTVSQEKRTKDVEKRLVKALKAGHSIDYLLDAIAFSNEKANKNYLSHLGRSIDEDWAQEGYHKEAEKKRQQAEEVKRKREEAAAAQKKKAEEKAEKEAAQKKRAEQVDTMLESVDLDDLDAFIGDQDLNSFNRTRFNRGKRDLLRRQYVAEFCGKQPSQTPDKGPDSKPCKRPVQQDLFGFCEASRAPVKEKRQKKSVKTVDPILISVNSYFRKKRPSQPKQMDFGVIFESLENKRINSKRAL